MATQVIQKKGGCLPDEQQIRLLKAALLKPEIALAYWQEWLMHTGYSNDMLNNKNFLALFFDPIDIGSERIIPLVQKNLSSTDDPFIKALLGNRRKVWVENQYHIAKAKKIIELFTANQIPVYFPKGLPISILYYNDLSVRASADLDLLVEKKDFERAFALLQAPPLSHKFFKKDLLYLDTKGAIHLYDSNSRSIDLHRSILQEYSNIDWLHKWTLESTETFFIDGVEAQTLNMNKLLYLSIVHGRQYDRVPPIRWVCDAYFIYSKRSDAVNWFQLIEWSVKLKHTFFMKQALTILKDHFITEIPADVIEYINRMPITWVEKTYYSIIQSNKNKTKFIFRKILKRYTQFKLFNTANSGESFVTYLLKIAYLKVRYKLMPSIITE